MIMRKGEMTQALKDCGCSEEEATTIASLVEQGDKKRALAEISSHRKSLLDEFHRCDSCISRTDYITAEIERA